MFGYIRFALAFLVMLSHIGVRVYGLNPGVMAVVIFYILAGYVVSHLFNDSCTHLFWKASLFVERYGGKHTYYSIELLHVL